ncbi:MAG TPA: hypothetical protein VK670_15510 [Silvibacterium sp.]|nr:hypothetical protein [Silvibacterium sp.]
MPALTLGGEEGLAKPLLSFWGDARTIVGYGDGESADPLVGPLTRVTNSQNQPAFTLVGSIVFVMRLDST